MTMNSTDQSNILWLKDMIKEARDCDPGAIETVREVLAEVAAKAPLTSLIKLANFVATEIWADASAQGGDHNG
jgi:hypothetical protein